MARVEIFKGPQTPAEMPGFQELLAGKEYTHRRIASKDIETASAVVDEAVLKVHALSLSPLIVREHPRIDNTTSYDVITGFHTAVAAKRQQHETIPAFVYPYESLQDDDVTELRVRAAVNGNPTLRNARLATTLIEAFSQTPFATNGVSVEHALEWIRPNVTEGNRKGLLTPDELAEVKAWAKRMTQAAEMTSLSLLTNIVSPACKSDLEIVRQARSLGRGKRATPGIITYDQLSIIATAFPHDYAQQKELIKKASQEALSALKVRDLVNITLFEQSAGAVSQEGTPERWLLEPHVSEVATYLEGKPKELISLPIADISVADSDIIDARYVSELQNAIVRGQRLPTIKVATIVHDGETQYHLFDGTHTLLARQQTEYADQPILAHVYHDLAADEIIHARLLATKEGPDAVRYSRLFTILSDTFAKTSFAKAGISFAQALEWTYYDIGKTADPAIVEPMKQWAKNLEPFCGISIGTINTNIVRWAKYAAPDLIRKVRNRGSTALLTGELTTRQLTPIVLAFRDNHELQQTLAKVVAAAKMEPPEVTDLLEKLQQIRVDTEAASGDVVKQLEEQIKTVRTNLRQRQREGAAAKGHATRSEEKSKRLDQELTAAKATIADLRANVASLGNTATTAEHRAIIANDNLSLTTQKLKTTTKALNAERKKNERLAEENKRLQALLAQNEMKKTATTVPETVTVFAASTSPKEPLAEQAKTTDEEEQTSPQLSSELLLEQAQATFYFIPVSRWNTLIKTISYTNEKGTSFSGEEALEASIVPRLSSISEQLNWKSTAPIVAFLSAAHINLYAQTKPQYPEKVQMQEVITKAKEQFPVAYTDLLQYLLYERSPDELTTLIQESLKGDYSKGAQARIKFRQFNDLYQKEGITSLFLDFIRPRQK